MTQLFIFILFFYLNNSNSPILDHNIIYSKFETNQDTIPQGKFEYELYFSEWGGRMSNATCEIIISGNQIKVLQTNETKLTGGKIIIEGILIKHKSGKWVIADKESDKNAKEIGGCTGGPVPIDFLRKIIEWC